METRSGIHAVVQPNDSSQRLKFRVSCFCRDTLSVQREGEIPQNEATADRTRADSL